MAYGVNAAPTFFCFGPETIAAMLLFVIGVGFSGFAVRWLSIYLTLKRLLLRSDVYPQDRFLRDNHRRYFLHSVPYSPFPPLYSGPEASEAADD